MSTYRFLLPSARDKDPKSTVHNSYKSVCRRMISDASDVLLVCACWRRPFSDARSIDRDEVTSGVGATSAVVDVHCIPGFLGGDMQGGLKLYWMLVDCSMKSSF